MPQAASSVLVIDDEAEILDLVSLLLRAKGYDVVTAANGQEALAALAHGLPDLVLLDMRMPVMDGWAFSRAFHDAYDRRVPIVVVTAAEDARRRADEIGAEGYLGKPFDLDELLEVVRRHVKRGGHGV